MTYFASKWEDTKMKEQKKNEKEVEFMSLGLILGLLIGYLDNTKFPLYYSLFISFILIIYWLAKDLINKKEKVVRE